MWEEDGGVYVSDSFVQYYLLVSGVCYLLGAMRA